MGYQRIENQGTISAWADQTFGPVNSDLRIAIRAAEEAVEACRAITTGQPPAKIAEELADTVIVLYRLAERHKLHLDNDQGVIQDTNVATSKTEILPGAIMAVIGGICAVVSKPDGSFKEDLAEGFALLTACCVVICERLGTNLYEEIDRKMAVNRAREWKLDGSGHGYHVRKNDADRPHSNVDAA
jgi:hypothetical protein